MPTLEGVSADELTQIFDEPAAECEVVHVEGYREGSLVPEMPPCSVAVTHRYVVVCQSDTYLTCQAFASWIIAHHEAGIYCSPCRRHTRLCWTLTAV